VGIVRSNMACDADANRQRSDRRVSDPAPINAPPVRAGQLRLEDSFGAQRMSATSLKAKFQIASKPTNTGGWWSPRAQAALAVATAQAPPPRR